MTSLLKAVLTGSAVVALAAMFDASAVVNAADGSSLGAPAKHRLRKSTDVGARRHYARAVAPVDDGHYYDRPVAYRPYPYVLPAPFPFGIGFDPWW